MKNRLSASAIVPLTFALAAMLCLVAAQFAVGAIERTAEIETRRALDESSFGWAEVTANGLQVVLLGTAPDEAQHFAALSIAGSVVDAARVVDRIEITPAEDLTPPHFLAEILRNDSGISIIGLVPAASDRTALVARLTRMAGDSQVTDLLETAAYPVPEGWERSLNFALTALEKLPRAKVSVDSERVAITAISDSAPEKSALQAELSRMTPAGVDLVLDISAPRPVITPFTLRFLIDEDGARFDSCSADTDAAARRILAAAEAAGLEDGARCTVGMGVPSPRWAEAAEAGIQALAKLGEGSVTFSDADITLVASDSIESARFDRVMGELETALPDVFALNAVLSQSDAEGEGPPEFTASLDAEGKAQLRGRLNDAALREMADSYARASFGSSNVYTATRQVENLPNDWPVRVLTGLEALSKLVEGSVTVRPDAVTVTGVSERPEARSEVSQLLAEKLGESGNFDLAITYRESEVIRTEAPSPEECEAQLAKIQRGGKITFEPGAATISGASRQTMSAIVKVLDRCGEMPLEIQGHTDSQGREEMNLRLSQERADAVLAELRARRILTGSFKAVGYGASRPIADNGTEEGREENRRIEFQLISDDAADGAEDGADDGESESESESDNQDDEAGENGQ